MGLRICSCALRVATISGSPLDSIFHSHLQTRRNVSVKRMAALALVSATLLIGQRGLRAQSPYYAPQYAPVPQGAYGQMPYGQPQAYGSSRTRSSRIRVMGRAIRSRCVFRVSTASAGIWPGAALPTAGLCAAVVFSAAIPGVGGQYPQQGYGQPQDYAQQPGGQALNADQLEQLVAPIALYPDTLVAQVLAASTYPAQCRMPTAGCRRKGMLRRTRLPVARMCKAGTPA